MKIDLLGIGGTFMAGLARLALAAGHEVGGCDGEIYPPMSGQLADLGVKARRGYAPEDLPGDVDCVIVGNALGRGNVMVEHLLKEGLPLASGPQWLAENILPGRHVLAVAGTHGKTTTAAILSWILHAAGKRPGFLIGGVAENFGLSARLGESDLFVLEADEYDSAFFDKRAKFIHYRPRTVIINNIEFDHADIFRDLDAVLTQFHHLVRTVPGDGRIVINDAMENCRALLRMGVWTPVVGFSEHGANWSLRPERDDYARFSVYRQGRRFRQGRHSRQGRRLATARWPLIGVHNALNALAAIAAAAEVGVAPEAAADSLREFKGAQRRLQKVAAIRGIHIYDDFAHHPTAIRLTLQAMRAHIDSGDGGRLIAVFEPRSNSMKMGIHQDTLAAALGVADRVCLYRPPGLEWDLRRAMAELGDRCVIYDAVADMIEGLRGSLRGGDHVIIMSNGGFEDLRRRLPDRLRGEDGEAGAGE